MSSQHRTVSRRARILTITGIGIVSALMLSACTPEARNGWLPTDRDTTNHTGMITDLWVNSWIAALIVGVITWGLMIWCIIAYRRRKGTTGYPRQITYNMPLEIFYLTIPLFMVLVLFYFTDKDQQAIDNRDTDAAVKVNVIGKQWSWDFNYLQSDDVPGDVYETGVQAPLNGQDIDTNKLPTLYLPVNKPVELVLNSRDVDHSFWVPAFLQKRDLIPGKTNHINLTPQKEGTFEGKCAELCGEYHSEMLFQVKVVSDQEFQAHLNQLKEKGNTGKIGPDYDRNPDLKDTSK